MTVACGKGQMKKLKQFLKKHKGQINRVSSNGRTLLYVACMRGQLKAAKLLLKQPNIDFTTKDDYGKTPLAWAKEKGHTEIVKLLRQHGAKEEDVETTEFIGETKSQQQQPSAKMVKHSKMLLKSCANGELATQ